MVDSADVNRYIREISGEGFSAKDFRTWAGTLLAAWEPCAAGSCRNRKARKQQNH
jgi:DNA topoisomerase-1